MGDNDVGGENGLAPVKLNIISIDPGKLVNESFSRPVLRKDFEFLKKRFTNYGYNDSYLLSCRYATAPEIKSFYQLPPFNYSPEKVAEVADSAKKEGNSGGHTFLFRWMH